VNDKHENHLTIGTGYWTNRRHAMQHKSVAAGAILMMMLLLLSSGVVFAQSTTAAAQRSRPLVVMSFNVHGANPNNSPGSNCNPARIPKNMAKFKELIQKYQATLILVSEIHRRQAYDLAHSLGFPDPYFVPTKSPCGVDGRPDLDYGNAIISLYPLRDKRRYSLHTAKTDIAHGRREYTWLAAASLVVNGRRIRAYTTHLTASGSDGDRLLQVRGLRRIIPRDEAWAKVGHRALLGGDLNFRPDSDPYKELVTDDPATDESGLFIDAWKKRNPFDSGFTEPAGNPMRRIDYVLLEKQSGFGVVRAVVGDICTSNGICLSDHRPVIVELSFQ
jgi:endonuclease/exonuclease/phosphatase family metal-dependent hydrolase